MKIRLPDPPGRAGWAATGVLLFFTAASVAGYATFALHPQLLPEGELARSLYAVSFRRFAQLQILLALLAVGVSLTGVTGIRWLRALALVAVVSFLAEHVGTGIGFPFGGYRYTGLLGPRLGGRVPALIPLSWFVMSVPSYGLARWAFPGPGRRALRIGLATAFLVSWDLALDPAMSFLTAYWIWESPGPYYGMPWINLLGWTLTGIAIMAVMEATAAEWVGEVSPRWHAVFYGGVLAMPLGMLMAAGLWGAVLTTFAGLGAPTTVALARRRFRVPGASVGDTNEGEEPPEGRDRRREPADRGLGLAEIGGEA